MGGLSALAAVVAVGAAKLSALADTIEQSLRSKELIPMQTLTQEVTRENGSKVTVSTVRGTDESLADWIARHDAAVAALQGS